MSRFFLITFLFLIILSPAYSQIQFVENKGQWEKEVSFKASFQNGAFFLHKKGFTVLLHAEEDIEQLLSAAHGHDEKNLARGKNLTPFSSSLKVRSHAYKVDFTNASSNPEIVLGDALPGYTNYFIGNDPAKWKSNCKTFQSVTYKNIYPNIDLRYYTSGGRLKYDFIVHPGGEAGKISMKYSGADSLDVKNGELVIHTSVGKVKESYPYTYQAVNNTRKKIACNYTVKNNEVKFRVTPISAKADIVIDPTLIFSTLTGSTADNWGFVGAPGSGGTFFSAGICFAEGFPVSTGAFDQTFNGGINEDSNGPYDIVVMKFSVDGKNRLYATYLGGSGNEQPQSILSDAQGNLILTGKTNSSNFPSSTVFGPGGAYDIIAVKFNNDGTQLIGSVKIGGSNDDGINIRDKYFPINPGGARDTRRNYGDDIRGDVLTDASGNIYIISQTQSSNFIVTSGAFQKIFAGGPATGPVQQDGIIIKMDASLSKLIFSTYFGGSGNDACFSGAISPKDGSLYIAGTTTSTDIPGDKNGTVYNSFRGAVTDGFISQITPNGTSIIKTTYVGTDGNDVVYSTQFDSKGYLYILATTTGALPVINAAYSNPGGRQFIAKLNSDLSSFVYSTTFGTNNIPPNIVPTGFYVDKCENVYVSGWGGSFLSNRGYPNAGTNGLPVTADAVKSTTDGNDFYFFVLEKNAASLLYGSFFGQTGGFEDHVDGGMSRFDNNGILYQVICASCNSSNYPGVFFPTTAGSWSTVTSSTGCNLAAVKIDLSFGKGVGAGINTLVNGKPADSSVCTLPLAVKFTDTLAAGKRYTWNFGDGTSEVITTGGVNTVNHIYMSAGVYRARIVAIDSATCNIADTVYALIKAGTCYNACASSSVSYISDLTGTSYQWQVDDSSGFVNISNNSNYSGVASKNLQLNNVPGEWYGYKYRCMVNGVSSSVFTLKFVNYWIGSAGSAWENPFNWSCGKLPDKYSDVVINGGPVVISSNVSVAEMYVQPGVDIKIDPAFTLTILGH